MTYPSARPPKPPKKITTMSNWWATFGLQAAVYMAATVRGWTYGELMRRATAYYLTGDEQHNFDAQPLVFGAFALNEGLPPAVPDEVLLGKKKPANMIPWRASLGLRTAVYMTTAAKGWSYGALMRRAAASYLTGDECHDFESQPLIYGANVFGSSQFDPDSRV